MNKHKGFKNIPFEEVDCLFCGKAPKDRKIRTAPDRINNLPGTFHLSRCKRCRLVFQDPRPNESHIHKYYPDKTGYFALPKNSRGTLARIRSLMIRTFYGPPSRTMARAAKPFLWPIRKYLLSTAPTPRFVPGGRVLDIGCSHGGLLKNLEEMGWKTAGIEPNKTAATAAQKRGLAVKNCRIEDARFPKGHFDAIILNMVLEHLYDPKKVLRKIDPWLKKGGELIIAIPYFEGMEFRRFKNHAYGLQLPAHTYFFNKDHFKTLLPGYDLRFEFHNFDRDVIASAGYLRKETGKLRYRLLTSTPSRYLIVKPLVFILALLQKTSRVTVRATKR